MSRMTKTLKAVQRELKGANPKNNAPEESPQPLDLSSIEKASFYQGDQYSPHGNPLHSTALEEDLSSEPQDKQRSAPEKTGRLQAGNSGNPAAATQAKKAAQRVSKTFSKNSKENQEPQGAKAVRKVKGGNLPRISESREDAGTKRTSAPESNTSKNAGKGRRSAEKETPEEAQSQQRFSSSEELTDEDEDFQPSESKGAKRRSSSQRQSGHKQKRKSSSSSSSDRAGPSKKPRDTKSPIDLDLVLDAFQEFVTEYKQTLNSDAVKRSIDAVSHRFEEQLTEIITATKELNSVKRENNKIIRAINQKRTRLVEANNELIKAKATLQNIQKDRDEMEQRLTALREGSSLLTNLQELNRKYLKHRTAHPNEVETYGPSCMPAMLIEGRCIMGTEHQLKTVNDQLQQVLNNAGNE